MPPTSRAASRPGQWIGPLTLSSTNPTPATLEAAKRAWLLARDDYGPTEAYRFYGGPIDNEDGRSGGAD